MAADDLATQGARVSSAMSWPISGIFSFKLIASKGWNDKSKLNEIKVLS